MAQHALTPVGAPRRSAARVAPGGRVGRPGRRRRGPVGLRGALGVLAAGVLAATVAGCDAAPEVRQVTVATGGLGGVYHLYGRGLAEVAPPESGLELTARPTAASVANLRLVAAGEADVGFTLADVAALAVAGEPPFAEPLPVAALARVYDNRTHLVVRADSEVDSVADLTGHRVSVGAADSGTEMVAERVLRAGGVDPDDDIERAELAIRDSAAALRAGDIDAFFWSGGVPTQAVADLATAVPVRLVDLAEHVPALRREYGEHYADVAVPADTYPGVPATRTIGVPNLLVVRADLPDDVAEGLTRLLFEARDDLAAVHPVALQLNPRMAIATLPVPLHPGAAAYYREEKVYAGSATASPGRAAMSGTTGTRTRASVPRGVPRVRRSPPP